MSFNEPSSHPEEERRYRTMWIHSSYAYDAYRDVYDGDGCLIDLGCFGQSVEIVTAITENYGGFLWANDSVGDWVAIEKNPESSVELSPLAKLKLDLALALPVREAALLSNVCDNPENLRQITQALNDYVGTLDHSQVEALPPKM